MKMKIFYWFLFIFFIAKSGSEIFAKEIKFNEGKSQLTVFENTYSSFRFTSSVSGIDYFSVHTEKGMFSEISVPGFISSGPYGHPQLPSLSRLIEIPLNAEISVNIISYKTEEYHLSDLGVPNKIMPRQPSVSKSADLKDIKFIYDEAAYQTDRFSDPSLVTHEALGILRGVRIGRLEVLPFRYNPVTNTLIVYTEIEAEIVFLGGDITKTIALKEKYYSPLFDNNFNELVNYKPLEKRDVLSKYPIKYVIVADPMFKTTLQPFIQWKTRKGFYVVEAYTDVIGKTTSAITTYLKNLYTSGTQQSPAPTYVLLVGDIAQMPAYDGNSGTHPTDLYYFTYDGTTDIYADVYYGRFSATTTAQLQPQIDKTLEYEQYLMPDPSFLNNAVLVAGVDDTYASKHGNGQINYATSTYFNTAHGITANAYLYPESGNSASQIRTNVSNGVCYGNYTAHGSPSGWSNPGFSNNDVANLQNNHKYPLLVGNCCLTNKYDESACFGETLLRAANKGAIGYIGASNSSYWDEDFYFGVGARSSITVNPTYNSSNLGTYDCMFHEKGEAKSKWFVSNGQVNHCGKLAVTQGNGAEEYYWEIYHLMGDPSLMIYITVPDPITISFGNLQIGVKNLTVTTEEDAYVAISQNNVLLDAKLADASGKVTLVIPGFTQVGKADIVATKQNRAPYIGTVDIINNNAPPIADFSFVISDKCNGIIQFSDKSGTATSWLWNFGDGGTSSLQNPTHTYANNGTYTVDLTATNTYGSDKETKTNYITVNKSAVAAFSGIITDECKGIVKFTDTSSCTTSWLWDFGDGSTSSLQNPTHTYTTNGKFTVKLTATNSLGYDLETKTDYLTINSAQKPSVTDGSGLPNTSITLHATGAGTLYWYDVATGGTSLGTGTTFNTPILTQDKTYYVEDNLQGPVQKVGKTAQGTGGYFSGNDYRGLVFDVLVPVTIKSVKVYANTAGNRLIEVLNAPQSGNVLASKTINIPAGEQRITLDFNLPVGTNYHLKVTGAGSTVDLHRDNTGASYPYQIANLVSIRYANTDDPVSDYEYYYYFYDWEVQRTGCISARTPCLANVITSVIEENESASFVNIYPNPGNGQFTLSLASIHEKISVQIINLHGQQVYQKKISDISTYFDLGHLSKGCYTVKIITSGEVFYKKIIIE